MVNGKSDLQAGGGSIVDGAQLPQASMKVYGLPEGKEEDTDWSLPRNNEPRKKMLIRQSLGMANFEH